MVPVVEPEVRHTRRKAGVVFLVLLLVAGFAGGALLDLVHGSSTGVAVASASPDVTPTGRAGSTATTLPAVSPTPETNVAPSPSPVPAGTPTTGPTAAPTPQPATPLPATPRPATPKPTVKVTPKPAPMPTPTPLPLSLLVGNWTNTNSSATGIASVAILANAVGTYSVHVYGVCSPTPCDWGLAPLTSASPTTASATYTGYRVLTLSLSGSKLHVTSVRVGGGSPTDDYFARV